MISEQGQAISETQIVRTRRRSILAGGRAPLTPAGLLELWTARRSEHTKRSYMEGLSIFAEWAGCENAEAAAVMVCGLDQGDVNRQVESFAATLRQSGLAPATINHRIALLKSLLKTARRMGLTDSTVEVEREKAKIYRDTRGPALEKVSEIMRELTAAANRGRLIDVRNLAMVRLLFNHGLRCHEVIGLDVEHYDYAKRELSILGKGRTEREPIALADKAFEAVERWAGERGTDPGPFFTSCRPGGRRGVLRRPFMRLHRRNIGDVLKPFGVRPHGLRHAAITLALEKTQGNISAVQRFSRHLNAAVVMTYEDNRQKLGKYISDLLNDLA
jgi:integrase/recombinase XerC